VAEVVVILKISFHADFKYGVFAMQKLQRCILTAASMPQVRNEKRGII